MGMMKLLPVKQTERREASEGFNMLCQNNTTVQPRAAEVMHMKTGGWVECVCMCVCVCWGGTPSIKLWPSLYDRTSCECSRPARGLLCFQIFALSPSTGNTRWTDQDLG